MAKATITKNYSESFVFIVCLISVLIALVSEILYRPENFRQFTPPLESGSDESEKSNISIWVRYLHPDSILWMFIGSAGKLGGALFNALYLRKFDLDFVLSVNFVLMISSNVLFIIGKNSFYVVMIGWIAFNFALTAILPLLVTLVEERVTLSSKKIGVIYFVTYIGVENFYFVFELFFDYDDSENYFKVGLGFLIFTFLLYSFLVYFLEKKRLAKVVRMANLQNSSYINSQFTDSSHQDSVL